ncbi:substrate-binding periplasmic protein [Vibrio sinaloensis]|uniref:substrate-binding periplasmic protein n=1 Tax=Photobacterium sp. (strain ATCC 43367) TaxID=379097 RepID=UPI0020610DB3|nr:transporter substrate-binding domain-containing protein [Vibrio sinaloensis]UPQ90249.1 transporter substrate-binding domain-containing protein [Vibrio sinaloensis]
MIHFWNGNKSAARQAYEHQLLALVLRYADIEQPIDNDLTDYPKARDEGLVFERGTDVLVTVAGNRKFADQAFIEVPIPLCKGLLGCRVAIIPRARQAEFANMSQQALKQQRVGVPATWVDAELFRHNQYHVVEKGSLSEMLEWIASGEVDYMTLGANEAAEILAQYPQQTASLMIEPTKVLTYPFPVVFYVSPSQQALADALTKGLREIMANGEFDALFNAHFGQVLKQVDLASRETIALENPLLPQHYQSPD